MSTQRQKLEALSAKDIASLLERKGFASDVSTVFQEQEMDGEAVAATLAAYPGPDCLKDILPKLGQRVKVYKVLQNLIAADYKEDFEGESSTLLSSGSMGNQHLATSDLFKSSSSSPPASIEGSDGPECSRKRSGEGSSLDLFDSSDPSPSASASLGQECKKRRLTSNEKSETGKIPDPFPIPRFRKCTQDRLDNNRFADDDRIYMVSVLGTVLLTYVEKASRSDCLKVTSALLRKYPFIKEPHSWQYYLYNKCQNLNRSPSGKQSAGPSPKSSKSPKSSNSAHNYPSIENEEDETAYKRNLDLLNKELKAHRPSSNTLKELMSRTFSARRSWIVSGSAASAHEVWTTFPLLKKAVYVEEEFERIMKRSNMKGDFADSWDDWLTATNEYALSIRKPSTGLRHALRDYPSGTSDDDPAIDVHEWEKLTAIRCLGQYLMLKKKGGSKESNPFCDIPFVLNICRSGTPPSECVDKNNNLPHIVKLCNSDYELRPQYFISLEQELIVERNTIFDALYALIAVHYVYNVVYHSRMRNFFLFIEEKLLKLRSIDRSSKNANYESVVTGIETFLDNSMN